MIEAYSRNFFLGKEMVIETAFIHDLKISRIRNSIKNSQHMSIYKNAASSKYVAYSTHYVECFSIAFMNAFFSIRVDVIFLLTLQQHESCCPITKDFLSIKQKRTPFAVIFSLFITIP